MAQWFEIREHPIRITARGRWLHGDQPLHPRVEALFARHLTVTGDGSYAIALGFRRHPLQVDDAAFFVRSTRITCDRRGRIERVLLQLSDSSEEELDGATLMQAADNVLYCRIERDGMSVPCRFSPAQYHELALFAEPTDDAPCFFVAGETWTIAPYNPKPISKKSQEP